jgi:hypothetical protein
VLANSLERERACFVSGSTGLSFPCCGILCESGERENCELCTIFPEGVKDLNVVGFEKNISSNSFSSLYRLIDQSFECAIFHFCS